MISSLSSVRVLSIDSFPKGHYEDHDLSLTNFLRASCWTRHLLLRVSCAYSTVRWHVIIRIVISYNIKLSRLSASWDHEAHYRSGSYISRSNMLWKYRTNDYLFLHSWMTTSRFPSDRIASQECMSYLPFASCFKLIHVEQQEHVIYYADQNKVSIHIVNHKKWSLLMRIYVCKVEGKNLFHRKFGGLVCPNIIIWRRTCSHRRANRSQ